MYALSQLTVFIAVVSLFAVASVLGFSPPFRRFSYCKNAIAGERGALREYLLKLNIKVGVVNGDKDGNSINWNKNCKICKGKGAISCATCVGTGIDKVNGNIFERYDS